MSRFSKAEAEARGWVFVHDKPEETVQTAGNESRVIPASIRAEKTVGTSLINEEAETLGKLLERIALYEAQQEVFASDPTPVEITEDVPRDEAGIEQRSVLIRDAETGQVVAISEAEFASRSVNDALYARDPETGEKGMVFTGPTDAANSASESVSEAKRRVEDRRAAEPDPGPTKQVILDNPGDTALDSPGISGGSVLVVRDDEDFHGDVVQRREEESVQAEAARVQRQNEIGFHPAPADMPELAGVGVSIRDRAALGSEVPKQGQTAEVAEAVLAGDEPSTPPDESSTEAQADARLDAQEDKALEIRDEKGTVEADKPEAIQAVEDAGAEAEQKAADEASEQSEDTAATPDETPESEGDAPSTPAAPSQEEAPSEAVPEEPFALPEAATEEQPPEAPASE